MVRSRDEDQQTVRDIVIYDRSSGGAYPRVTIARKGKFIHSEDQRFLTVQLEDGFTYSEQGSAEPSGSMNGESRIVFRKQQIHLDLSQLKLRRSDETLFKDYYSMLNTRQLARAIDSLRKDNVSRDSALNGLILGQYHFGKIIASEPLERFNPGSAEPAGTKILNTPWPTNDPDLIQEALRQIQTVKSYMDMKNREMRSRGELLARYVMEFHRKFSLSFACLLLFMVGAPLGAVIRKGGLGLPTVWAIGCFLLYHVISISSEKLGRDGSLDPRLAMWVSSLFLLPLASWLIYRVNLDRKLIAKL
jgi:lipopolysaccharide export system permease protein